MLTDAVSVSPLAGSCLCVEFEDGASGTVNVDHLVPFEGVFAPLRDPDFFALVEVNQEIGTVCWPNGADLDPILLYAAATGTPLPEWAEAVLAA